MAIPQPLPEMPTEVSGFELHRVGITSDPKKLQRVIWILIDKMYENTTKSLFREYISNSIDSHIRAGESRLVEVTLPTDSETYLTIRDWGTGMTRDFLTNVYTMLGDSDKHDSTDESGQFGMGAKVVFGHLRSIGKEQALITTVRDGIKTEGVVLLNEGCVPDLALLDSTPTDEPNGCVFKIPTDPSQVYEDSAYIHMLAEYSDLIYITNPMIKPSNEDVLEQVETENYVLQYVGHKNQAASIRINGRVIINGMPYKYPGFVDEKLYFNRYDSGNHFKFLAKFKPNELEYTASRDAIRPESCGKIVDLLQEAVLQFRAMIQLKLDECPTALEASNYLTRSYGVSNFRNIQWRDNIYDMSLGDRVSVQTAAAVFPVNLAVEQDRPVNFMYLSGRLLDSYLFTDPSESEIQDSVIFLDNRRLRGKLLGFTKVPKRAMISRDRMENYPVVLVSKEERLGKSIAKELGLEGSFYVVKVKDPEDPPHYLAGLSTLKVYKSKRVKRVKSDKEIDLERKILSMSRSASPVSGREQWEEILSNDEISVRCNSSSWERDAETLWHHMGERTYNVTDKLHEYMYEFNSKVRRKFVGPRERLISFFKRDCLTYHDLEMLAYFGPDAEWLTGVVKDRERQDLLPTIERYRIYKPFMPAEFCSLPNSQETKLKFEEILKLYLPQPLLKALYDFEPLKLPQRENSRFIHRDKFVGDWQESNTVGTYYSGSQHEQIGRYVICRWLGLDATDALYVAFPGANLYHLSDRANALIS